MSIVGELTCPSCKEKRHNRYDPYKYPDRIVKCGRCSSLGNKRGCRTIHKPRKRQDGYLEVWISKDDFFFPMSAKSPSGNYGTIKEHRLVMAKHLGRCLQSWEIVHHKGIRYAGIENKQDNLVDNLELTGTNSEHIIDHSKGYKDGYHRGLADGRLKQIQELKEEIRRLRK